jgi:hypothetical protein
MDLDTEKLSLIHYLFTNKPVIKKEANLENYHEYTSEE